MSLFVSYQAPGGATTRATRSLYVHVPFCHTICGYCDFYSEVLDRSRTGPLVDALLGELDRAVAGVDARFDTIFVGGGTPTTLPIADLGRLLSRLSALRDPETGCEFTCEANPATVTPEVAETLVAGGVNRISVGAQSFDRGELAVLDRIHRPEQVEQTVKIARAAGIAQINLDLIFAVPGQSLASWRRNLGAALALGSDHLSCYGLTYEPGTPLFEQRKTGQLRPADEDLEAEMYEATIADLRAAGFEQYEISNFAKPGCECRHNLRYWNNDEYLGIGPSAAGFVGGVRYRNVPDTAAYVRAINAGKSPRVEEERRSLDEQAHDAAWLGLRTVRGIDRAAFARRYGHDPVALFAGVFEKHAAAGLVELTPERVRLTQRGLMLANVVAKDLV
jgi:oxygen-independent coproporphyrinogen-3 oxidase